MPNLEANPGILNVKAKLLPATELLMAASEDKSKSEPVARPALDKGVLWFKLEIAVLTVQAKRPMLLRVLKRCGIGHDVDVQTSLGNEAGSVPMS
ncbi:hypothetical protein AMAG_20070 [Allomyces macrogynus ATCC 38327]|uniref:Uncharacterized protein n=1 Tax=Allomyces macrogynus (strain ATCC 38327) TaxID=578462 RepID=A0A0L0T683_ALLM3|nr:hypothetical protein AMAG_20070 [Allomyces macrogynus ATCC 38327]|eukprot:KNE70260.1 hypothetical protein AMAG_20070 [Allomyces macrogynus ATCC 38327]